MGFNNESGHRQPPTRIAESAKTDGIANAANAADAADARSSTCPLCGGNCNWVDSDRRRAYFQCAACELIFVSPADRLSAAQEKACYDLHQNDPLDERYRAFLSRLLIPLSERLAGRSTGLDFGSGPGPTLSLMFEELGHTMHIYDPFYSPDRSVLTQTYDFITASEVVEHLHHPRQELELLWSLLRPGGWLGMMTKRVQSVEAFRTWHYRNDPTHVVFFSEQTFVRLAKHWQSKAVFPAADVVLMQKQPPRRPQ